MLVVSLVFWVVVFSILGYYLYHEVLSYNQARRMEVLMGVMRHTMHEPHSCHYCVSFPPSTQVYEKAKEQRVPFKGLTVDSGVSQVPDARG